MFISSIMVFLQKGKYIYYLLYQMQLVKEQSIHQKREMFKKDCTPPQLRMCKRQVVFMRFKKASLNSYSGSTFFDFLGKFFMGFLQKTTKRVNILQKGFIQGKLLFLKIKHGEQESTTSFEKVYFYLLLLLKACVTNK